MDSLRKLVMMLGGLAGLLGIASALFVLDWITLAPEITAPPSPPDDGARTMAVVGGIICLLAALAFWRAPRLAGVALVIGTVGMYYGLGYTPFTMLPIGFAALAAGLALWLGFTDERE